MRRLIVLAAGLLLAGLATCGPAVAQGSDDPIDEDEDPFADDEPLFNDSEDPFAEYEERATVPEDGEEDTTDDDGDANTTPDDGDEENGSPAWSLVATVGALGAVALAARRRA